MPSKQPRAVSGAGGMLGRGRFDTLREGVWFGGTFPALLAVGGVGSCLETVLDLGESGWETGQVGTAQVRREVL